MLIQAHHDRHQHHLPSTSHQPVEHDSAVTRAAPSPTHRIPWITVGTSYSNGRPRGLQSARALPMPFDAEDRPPSPPTSRQPGHDIFHEFATDWFTRYRQTVKPRTAEIAQNMLGRHALPFLHPYRLSEIDYALLASLREQKLKRNDEIAHAAEVGMTLRDAAGQRRRALSPRTINMSLDVISRVLNNAVKRKLIPTNPAADRALRLKANQHKRNSLEADELLGLINAAGTLDEPALPRTLARAARARRLRAAGRSWKESAPSSASPRPPRSGSRVARRESPPRGPARHRRHPRLRRPAQQRAVQPQRRRPRLRPQRLHRPRRQDRGRDPPRQHDPMAARRTARLPRRRPTPSPTSPRSRPAPARRRDRNNINRRVIAPAAAAANADRPDRPLPDAITAHTFRRTFITLMLEAGAPVP